ncbi:MAG TPA: hypothetical protein VGB53_17050 [Rubricoccaceae bacterium]|jgi:hypothetical protein
MKVIATFLLSILVLLSSPAALGQAVPSTIALFSRHKDSLGRFSIGLPPAWALEPPGDGDCFAAGRSWTEKGGQEGFTIINIGCEDNPGSDAFDAAELLHELDTPAGLATFLQEINEDSELNVRHESHGAGQLGKIYALRWVYRVDVPTADGPIPFRAVQYLASLPNLRGQYVFTCMTSRADGGEGIGVCDAVARTFTLVPESAPSVRM